MLFATSREMQKHYCPWPTYHIETPQRLSCILDRLEETGLSQKTMMLEAREATEEELELVHTKRYIEEIKLSAAMTVEQQEELCSKYEDIYINKDTWRLSCLAAGSSIDLAKRVYTTRRNGFAAVRPPGHHASPDAGCGFCIFNNVALAAKHAKLAGAKKIVILDWDVHAGQGTQECIENDEDIVLISIHRYEKGTFWPNLAQSAVLNRYANTVNVPINMTMARDSDYFAIMELVVLPIINDFKPDLIIVSCGFDAALGDPEGEMEVTPAGYATMTRMLQNTGVPIAMILEGGYFLDAVAASAEWVFRALQCEPIPPVEIRMIFSIIGETITRVHRKHWRKYDLFREFILLVDAFGCMPSHNLRVPEFTGERTVGVPYQTRGLYTPMAEEKVEAFRTKLNSIIAAYDPKKEYVLCPEFHKTLTALRDIDKKGKTFHYVLVLAVNPLAMMLWADTESDLDDDVDGDEVREVEERVRQVFPDMDGNPVADAGEGRGSPSSSSSEDDGDDISLNAPSLKPERPINWSKYSKVIRNLSSKYMDKMAIFQL